jgi:Tol biopolymer transport system component
MCSWSAARGASKPADIILPISRDGAHARRTTRSELAVVTIGQTTGQDIGVVDRRKPGQPRVFLNTKFREGAPTFSPDGRWIAYVSDKSGRNEVHMRPFQGSGEEWTISADGGNEPVWARNAPFCSIVMTTR